MEEAKQPDLETPEVLKKKLDAFTYQGGDKQFRKALLEAELLQLNQEIHRIYNKLREMEEASAKAASDANKAEPELRVVTPEAVIPA